MIIIVENKVYHSQHQAKKMFKIAIIITFLTVCSNLHAYPNQACPIFQYVSYNGINIGKVELNNDRSGSYRLSVNMSAASYLDNVGNIKLELRTSTKDIIKGNPLVFYIHFPTQTPLPKPTRIEFNGRVYCITPTEQAKPGFGVTNFWATIYISAGASSSGSHLKPEYNPYYPVAVEDKPKPNTEVVSTYPPIMEVLHPETPSNENNNFNTIVNPIEYTTPKSSDDLHTTLKTVNVVSNSTVDCVNTTTVDHKPQSNNQNLGPSKSSSYSYKCKEVHTINQSVHTVSVSKG